MLSFLVANKVPLLFYNFRLFPVNEIKVEFGRIEMRGGGKNGELKFKEFKGMIYVISKLNEEVPDFVKISLQILILCRL